jgi:competence ComEA-like helix-hairpin-helix protein
MRFGSGAPVGVGAWAAALAVAMAVGAPDAARAQDAAPPPIDLNTATQAELETLPGIGPTRARAILELREKLGRFRRVEQLLRVRGIGRATFRKLRPRVTVGSGASPARTGALHFPACSPPRCGPRAMAIAPRSSSSIARST